MAILVKRQRFDANDRADKPAYQNVYYIDYRDERGKRVRKSVGTSRKEAEEVYRKALAKVVEASGTRSESRKSESQKDRLA